MKFNALFLMLLLSVYPPFAQSQQDELTRTQFATKMARILAGTNQRQVVEQLGLPDIEMTTVNKQPLQLPAAARALGASEYWYYGTNELSDFPTLGQVYFDSNRNVIGTFGGSGSPIKTETISENIVQNTLRLINSMPPADGSNWDPIVASRVTNFCLDLGNDTAMCVSPRLVDT
ncbi:MAG: hypothetical protein JNK57_11435 [Planctomycetaceae bacterium]|nr:hypothetical protein [Planctomycetaceae bacterium]